MFLFVFGVWYPIRMDITILCLNSLANCLLIAICITKQNILFLEQIKGFEPSLPIFIGVLTTNIYTMSTNYIAMVGVIGVAPIELLKQQIYSLPRSYLRYKLPCYINCFPKVNNLKTHSYNFLQLSIFNYGRSIVFYIADSILKNCITKVIYKY